MSWGEGCVDSGYTRLCRCKVPSGMVVAKKRVSRIWSRIAIAVPLMVTSRLGGSPMCETMCQGTSGRMAHLALPPVPLSTPVTLTIQWGKKRS